MLREGNAFFHFSQPEWLFLLFLIPVMWAIHRNFGSQPISKGIEKFADAHLLPHLLSSGKAKGKFFSRLFLWSLLWLLIVLTLAGPRWNYTDIKIYAPAGQIVVLLDVSRSMDAGDVKPSRLVRARQEVSDVLRSAKGFQTGLVAFANIPHMISPVTEDRNTIESLLPFVKTDIVYTQGSRLSPALFMAAGMLKDTKSGKAKGHVLLISDGGFEDSSGQIYGGLRKLTDLGVNVHVLGVGSEQGTPVPDGKGGLLRNGRTGSVVMSALDSNRLREIAGDAGGVYVQAEFSQKDTQALLEGFGAFDVQQDGEKVVRDWDERFYIFLFPALLPLLMWFRKGANFSSLVIFSFFYVLVPSQAQAGVIEDYFLTKEQKGRKALQEKEYEQAEEYFKDDAYRRGVVQYRAGQYEEAARSFEEVERPEVTESARYNAGNAQLLSGKIEEAIKHYEDVLKSNPDHQEAAYNLEIARRMLEQKKDQSQGGSEDKSEKKNKDQEKKQENSSQDQEKSSKPEDQDSAGESQESESNTEEGEGQKKAEDTQSKEAEKKQEEGSEGSQDGSDEKSAMNKGEQEERKGKASENEDDNKKKGEENSGYPPQPNPTDRKNNEGAEKSESAMNEEGKEKKEGEKEKAGTDQKGKSSQDDKNQEYSEKLSSGDEEENDKSKPLEKSGTQEMTRENNSPVDKSAKLSGGEVRPNENGLPSARTPQDVNADRWLDRIESDTDTFLKNKFYIESEREGAREGGQSW